VKVILKPTGISPRSYYVTLDFTSYHKESPYFPYYGTYYTWRAREVPIKWLDSMLKPLKLNRIEGWKIVHNHHRVNIYYTTVISDRMNKRNAVG